MSEGIRVRATKILSMALGRPVEPGSDPCRDNTAEWDSLKHVELILLLEEEFNIRFSGQEVNALRSLDDIVQQVVKKNGT